MKTNYGWKLFERDPEGKRRKNLLLTRTQFLSAKRLREC